MRPQDLWFPPSLVGHHLSCEVRDCRRHNPKSFFPRLSASPSRQRGAMVKSTEPGQHPLSGAVMEGAEQQAVKQARRAGSTPITWSRRSTTCTAVCAFSRRQLSLGGQTFDFSLDSTMNQMRPTNHPNKQVSQPGVESRNLPPLVVFP